MSISDERLREIRTRVHRALCHDGCDDALHADVDRVLDESIALRADADAKAREALEAVRARIKKVRERGEVLNGIGAHDVDLFIVDEVLAALPPSPRATQGGEVLP